jgi:hypothetical protein
MKHVLTAILCLISINLSAQQKIKVVNNQAIKMIEPKIGFTPDISDDAKKNLQRLKLLYKKIDSTVSSYPSYEKAKQHLTKRQIDIYENEEEYSKEDHLDVSVWGCSWYCGGGPNRITASSALVPDKQLDYKATNAHDFSLRTAWVEGRSGNGIGESITYKFAKQSPPVTTVEIFNGYMKSNKVWKENARVKQLKMYVNNKPFAILNLKDITSKQIFAVGTLQGTKGDLYLKFEIADVYNGDKYDDVAIAELEFDGTGVHCFAKGTMVSTPNGPRAIELLKVGDKVLSLNEAAHSIEISIIQHLASQKHHNLYELNFSGNKIVATDDHPFFYKGHYYSVKQNSKYGLQTKVLKKGQAILFLINGQLKALKLTSLKRQKVDEMTYTITKLDINRLFFANSACVAVEEVKIDDL